MKNTKTFHGHPPLAGQLRLVTAKGGYTLIELLLFTFTLLLLLGALIFVLFDPDFKEFADKTVLLALLSVIVGGIAWGGKQTLSTLNRRAKLLILERLSDGNPRTREEIKAFLNRQSLLFGPLHQDALAELTLSGRLFLKEGKFIAKLEENGEGST